MRFLALAPLALLVACNGHYGPVDKGPPVSKNYGLRDFDQVKLAGSDNVTVQTGNDFSIKVSGPKSAVDELELTVNDKTLTIGRKSNSGFSWGSRRHDDVQIMVTMPSIHAASISGSGDIKLDRAEGDFNARVSGSGDLAIGTLSGGTTDLSVSGSGNIAAAGAVTQLKARVTGSGDIKAEQLVANSGDVSITGSGNIRATVNGQATVHVVGSGDVDLGKGARCTTSKTGSGDVSCG